jgi:hypothetical protein
MSSQVAYASGRSIIVQASGDNNTINVRGDAHLELIPAGRLAAAAISRKRRPDENTDLHLLSPAARAVPFTGRDRDLAGLRAWLTSDSYISVRAVIGPGGSGNFGN